MVFCLLFYIKFNPFLFESYQHNDESFSMYMLFRNISAFAQYSLKHEEVYRNELNTLFGLKTILSFPLSSQVELWRKSSSDNFIRVLQQSIKSHNIEQNVTKYPLQTVRCTHCTMQTKREKENVNEKFNKFISSSALLGSGLIGVSGYPQNVTMPLRSRPGYDRDVSETLRKISNSFQVASLPGNVCSDGRESKIDYINCLIEKCTSMKMHSFGMNDDNGTNENGDLSMQLQNVRDKRFSSNSLV